MFLINKLKYQIVYLFLPYKDLFEFDFDLVGSMKPLELDPRLPGKYHNWVLTTTNFV